MKKQSSYKTSENVKKQRAELRKILLHQTGLQVVRVAVALAVHVTVLVDLQPRHAARLHVEPLPRLQRQLHQHAEEEGDDVLVREQDAKLVRAVAQRLRAVELAPGERDQLHAVPQVLLVVFQHVEHVLVVGRELVRDALVQERAGDPAALQALQLAQHGVFGAGGESVFGVQDLAYFQLLLADNSRDVIPALLGSFDAGRRQAVGGRSCFGIIGVRHQEVVFCAGAVVVEVVLAVPVPIPLVVRRVADVAGGRASFGSFAKTKLFDCERKQNTAAPS